MFKTEQGEVVFFPWHSSLYDNAVLAVHTFDADIDKHRIPWCIMCAPDVCSQAGASIVELIRRDAGV